MIAKQIESMEAQDRAFINAANIGMLKALVNKAETMLPRKRDEACFILCYVRDIADRLVTMRDNAPPLKLLPPSPRPKGEVDTPAVHAYRAYRASKAVQTKHLAAVGALENLLFDGRLLLEEPNASGILVLNRAFSWKLRNTGKEMPDYLLKGEPKPKKAAKKKITKSTEVKGKKRA